MRYCITISGKVQGVWFRKYAHDKAMSLGLRGYVENRPNGTVYAEIEGEAGAMEAFADWCSIGSPMSQVSGVDVTRETSVGYTSFDIRK